MTFDMDDFDEIEANGNFDVYIMQGNDYSIELKGERRYLDRASVKKINDVLEINFNHKRFNYLRDLKERNKVRVFITMPELESLEGDGACNFSMERFDIDDLKIDLSGASEAELDVDADDIDIELSGVSKAILSGSSDYFDAKLTGASSLRAFDLDTECSNITARDGSSARVSAREKLYIEATGLSTVKYKGDAEVTYDEEDLSTIQRSID